MRPTMMRGLAAALLAVLLLGLPSAAAQDGLPDSADLSLELIDPEFLRVCADPNNLPFSNQQGEGFENKIAELLAAKLGKQVDYTWFPQVTGFVRNTLGAHKCDVIIGYPQGDEIVQNTNPYYRTSYALVFVPGKGLDGIESLADPRLGQARVGVVAGTPAGDHLVRHGLIDQVHSYPLLVDTRVDSAARSMVTDLQAGTIDVGILWGPLAAHYARGADPKLQMVPLLREPDRPRLIYNITMGVRASDQEWKRTLNRLIRANQKEIDAILLDYGIPLLDQRNRPIAAP
ncbi:substrate-binding domain-containing protein [Geminicoccus flavidas]|uniref:substrate-binding domain-containing protein n=1 Tax=Geminicoccus flavidas TaxID=2506407 RepID=UPI001358B815|nr:substrate-binding domain-containing protein [Geminicoccus flavidas]